MAEIGTVAGEQYSGNGLAVTPTSEGAQLRCVFQKLKGEANSEGLWLSSTGNNQQADRFRVKAAAVRRESADRISKKQPFTSDIQLPATGNVTIDGQGVRFNRPGLIEEYSVSLDGVRQNFVLTKPPAGSGQLQVRLDVTGARVERAGYGAELLLEKSGRKIAYSRLRVTDAKGRELPARIEKVSAGELAVMVKDANAVYPVRIDPTFSDANWISMGESYPGANGQVYAAVIDGAGNLFIGGVFSLAR